MTTTMINKDDLLTLMIRTWGFEHERTIAFANAMEVLDIDELSELFNDLMNEPIEEEQNSSSFTSAAVHDLCFNALKRRALVQ